MKNMDKSIKVLIIMVLLVTILYVVNMFINKNEEKDYSKVQYIELKDEKISSIYNVIGYKSIVSVNEGVDTTGNYIEIIYNDLSIFEVADYLTNFRNNGYTLISSDEKSAVIANEFDDNKIITINVQFVKDQTKIKYSNGNGTITKG